MNKSLSKNLQNIYRNKTLNVGVCKRNWSTDENSFGETNFKDMNCNGNLQMQIDDVWTNSSVKTFRIEIGIKL